MSLPLSLYAMSVMQFALIIFWAYEGYYNKITLEIKSIPKWILFPLQNIKIKIEKLKSNKIALLIISIYVIHLLGLIFTENFKLAFDDLRTKLPLLSLTIIIGTSKPISKKQLNVLFLFYIAAIISGTFFGLYKFMGHNFMDLR